MTFQVFFRAGGLARLEDLREEKLTDWVMKLQAFSRGYLGRKNYQKLKVNFLKLLCIKDLFGLQVCENNNISVICRCDHGNAD